MSRTIQKRRLFRSAEPQTIERTRIVVISVFIFLAAGLFFARLFSLQIMKGEIYAGEADRQYTKSSGNNWQRGTISYTEAGDEKIYAVTMGSRPFLAINPRMIMDATSTYDTINKIIPTEPGSFFQKANKKDDPYEVLKKDISTGTARSLMLSEIPGVIIGEESVRAYPAGKLAAQVLGFVSRTKDGGDLPAGQYGLERQYEDVLRRDRSGAYSNFFTELFRDAQKKASNETTEFGEGDIALSISSTVQTTVEHELAALMKKWGAESAGAIVMDPKNGDIVSMAHAPSFNLNEFQKEKDQSVFGNPLVENVFEMGSIVKPITIAIVLNEGVLTASSTYEDKGFLILDNKRIENYDGKARGIVSMQEVLNQSLNTGAVFAAEKVGKEKFGEKMLEFGIAERTGIDLPSEARGLSGNLASPRDIEYATASFGQGIAWTPIGMARALSVLSNEGLMVRPHVVSKIEYTSGLSRTISGEMGRRIISADAARQITRMLVTVTDNALLGGKYKMEHYSVAAKTGTAQIAKETGRGYYEDRNLHTFFGYFPAAKPRFLVFLFLKNPKGVRYASETLTDPFFRIAKFLIQYYDVPPDR